MAVIAIFSGSYCGAEEVIQKVADALGYELITDRLLEQTSRHYGVAVDKLKRAMRGPTPFLNRISHEREKHTAYLKATLAELIKDDNIVYHGYATLLIPAGISHVLKICLMAEHNYRVIQAARALGISEKEADAIIRKDDNEQFQWARFLLEQSPWDEDLYDITLPMHSTSIEKSAQIIVENSRKGAVHTTAGSRQAMADFALSAKVGAALIEKHPDVEVSAIEGRAVITINKYVKRVEHKKEELKKPAAAVPGVKEVEVKIGPKFNMPSIYPPEDFELPQKVLLVDDEKEFVHTLSERLQTRHLESAVVYDGEEALSFIEGDQPEVMVLDLKMPGIDGIEVLRRVKKEHPETEVIILTGHGSEREEKLAGELGAFAYLQKPVDIDKLSATMKAAYKKIRQQTEDDKPDRAGG